VVNHCTAWRWSRTFTERKHAEEALINGEERYRSFIANSSEGIWRSEAERSVDTSLPVDQQIELFYKYGYLAECNDAMARMYGYSVANEIVGARLGDLLLASDAANIAAIRAFIRLSLAERAIGRRGQKWPEEVLLKQRHRQC
jgi:PAS domain-containing protein